MNPSKLLTSRDLDLEAYIQTLLNQLQFEPNISPAELEQVWIDKIETLILTEMQGTVLLKKIQPLIPLMVKKKIEGNPIKTVSVEPVYEDDRQLVLKYKTCFDAFLDSPFASFKTLNKHTLGNIKVKDYFILQYLITATCKRIRGDGNLQLGLSGASSIGKSVIFEGPLIANSHIYTAERGIGRFVAGNKPILLMNDICVHKLVYSDDIDTFKNICRGEVATAKTHGSTCPIKPIFVFYTSNTRLFNHIFKPTNIKEIGRPYLNHVEKGKRSKTIEEINSIRNRFIELFSFAPPPHLDIALNYPKSGTFQPIHLILGTFSRIVTILKQYNKTDFTFPMLYIYTFTFLFQYIALFEEMFCDVRYKDDIINMARDYLDDLHFNNLIKLL